MINFMCQLEWAMGCPEKHDLECASEGISRRDEHLNLYIQ